MCPASVKWARQHEQHATEPAHLLHAVQTTTWTGDGSNWYEVLGLAPDDNKLAMRSTLVSA